MFDFQKKKKIRKILYSPFTLIFLFLIFFVLVSGVWGVYKKTQLSYQNLEREKKELEKLAIREKKLNSSLNYLKTDQGIENEIRTKFRAIKEGERVAVIVDSPAAVMSPLEDTNVSTTSLWYRLVHWAW